KDPAKRKSYKDRLFDDAEAYDVTGMKVKKEDVVQNYPLATRVAPSQDGDPSVVTLRNKMIIAFQKNKDAEAKEYAEQLRDSPKANVNDKATAVKVLTLLVTKVDRNNHASAIPLLEEAMQINGLDNNAHYAQMSELAQRLLLEQDYPEAYKWAERFLQETKAEKIEILKVKGNALFRMPNRVKDSLAPLEKVHAMDPTDVQATQMLAKAYADSGDSKKAAELTKLVVQATGNDRISQVNLAITYFDSKQYDEAYDVIAQLRSTNQLVDERDYLTAINVYKAMKNKDADLVAVMEAGFASGALKPTASRYSILAEAYYYGDNMQKAIETWNKAAPMAKDGKIYLNLAIVQCQNQLYAACKESAKNAIAKGGINPEDAKKQIAIAEKAK
ncbi:MAG: tetratricopeptide repeat protein, partial [Arenimonas sp.]